MLLLCKVSVFIFTITATNTIIIIVIITATIIIILSECNTETSENGTYFTNPMSLSSVCSLMIRPMSDQICQVHKVFGRFVSGREIQDEKHPGPP